MNLFGQTINDVLSSSKKGSTQTVKVAFGLAVCALNIGFVEVAAAQSTAAPSYSYNADSTVQGVKLPPAHQAALDKVLPGFTPYTGANAFDAGSESVYGLVTDINGDKRADAVFAGTSPNGMLAVVALYAVSGVVKTAILLQDKVRAIRPDEEFMRSPDGRAKISEVLTLEKEKGVKWIRWQNGDCKGPGWDWTFRGGVFVKRRSRCTYGE